MTDHPDKAREAAALVIARDWLDDQGIHDLAQSDPSGMILDTTRRAIDAFLAASVPAGDHIHQALARLRHQPGGPTKEQREFVASVIEGLAAKLTAQKAAHAKMMRDRAAEWDTWGTSRIDHKTIATEYRRLADKIEGGE